MSRMRVGGIALVCVAAVGAAVSSSRGSRRANPVRHEVQMRAISFTPAELVVAVGDTVEWRNADIVRLKPGEPGSWVPSDTGTFIYRCTIHARMRGKIVVR